MTEIEPTQEEVEDLYGEEEDRTVMQKDGHGVYRPVKVKKKNI